MKIAWPKWMTWKRARRWKRWLEPFTRAMGWTAALFMGYFAGLVDGPVSGVIAFAMCAFALAAMVGSFLCGYALGQNVRGGFIREMRRLRMERNPTHTRTPACIHGRRAPCRDAVCDCGHHCGRHGLVVSGYAPIKPPGCEKSGLLTRCSVAGCDCTGWRES
jgi:hypothetical protein